MNLFIIISVVGGKQRRGTQNRGMLANQIAFHFALKPQNLKVYVCVCVRVCVCALKITVRGDEFQAQINTEEQGKQHCIKILLKIFPPHSKAKRTSGCPQRITYKILSDFPGSTLERPSSKWTKSSGSQEDRVVNTCRNLQPYQ